MRHCWSQFQGFLFFGEFFQFDKFEGADFKYGNPFLKFYPKKTQIRHCCFQALSVLFSRETLQFNKFERADLKYDYSFLKFYA